MANITKMRIRNNEGQTEVLVLIEHPMNTDFVETMIFSVNGSRVAELGSGPGLANNPFAAIRLPLARPGDMISVDWTDNQGRTGRAEAKVE